MEITAAQGASLSSFPAEQNAQPLFFYRPKPGAQQLSCAKARAGAALGPRFASCHPSEG